MSKAPLDSEVDSVVCDLTRIIAVLEKQGQDIAAAHVQMALDTLPPVTARVELKVAKN